MASESDQAGTGKEDELEKYKRMYEEQRAKVVELERANSQLKVSIQHIMELRHQREGTPVPPPAAPVTRPNQRGGRTKGAPTNTKSTHTTPAAPNSGRQHGMGGSGGGRNGGGGHSTTSQPSSASGSEKQDTKPKVPETPQEPNIRDEIVVIMRAAAMSKDSAKLEEAIAKADAAGLSFEANQGRRQLGRIRAALG